MGHVDYTGFIIHTETFYLGCCIFAGPVIIQIQVYLLVSRQEVQGSLEIGYTVQYAHVARKDIDSLILDP